MPSVLFGSAFRLLQFGGEFQPPQSVVPHTFQFLPQWPEHVGARTVVAITVLRSRFDQARSQERFELQRYCTERDIRHPAMNLSGRQFLRPNESQDLLSPWGRERGQDSRFERHGMNFS